ncbi:MAG: baseplate J/gp47 family protein [Clostridium sp.]|nr:baseplate J/gp47 family protein [Clostridium sp.]
MLAFEEREDLDFEERLEQAKEKIDRIYPAWTNYNPADSGMALLELFAYMTEMQQFHVRQIGEAHRRAFLHLLGMNPHALQPAEVYARVENKHTPFMLLKGTKALAGELSFEAEESIYMEPGDCLLNMPDAPFYPFGEDPGLVETYDIGLKDALECGEIHTLYIGLCDSCPVARTPIEKESFLPFVKLQIQYYDGMAYQNCEIREDTTFGMLQTGILKFQVKGCMGKRGEEYRLRLVAQGEYDTAPQINRLQFNIVPFVQKDTVMEWKEYSVPGVEADFFEVIADTWLLVNGEVRIYQKTEKGYVELYQYSSFLSAGRRHFVIARQGLYGESGDVVFRLAARKSGMALEKFVFRGTGKPDQIFYLNSKNVLGTSFSIWVEEEKDSGFFVPWTPVSALEQAAEGERCYLLEEQNGILRFGNGRQGRMPNGRIEVTAYAVCEGIHGNIQKNQLSEFQSEKRAEGLINFTDAFGGRNPETLSDCLNRYKEETKEKKRAVTLEDYEKLVRQTPGLRIKKTRVFPSLEEENSLEIVVEPYTNGKRRMQKDGYDRNIMRYIEPRKMLGTGIVIKKPEYIRVRVNLEVLLKNHFWEADDRIRESIKQYFDEYMDFGKTISFSRLYGYIESLPETEQVTMLEIYADGKGVSKERNKDIQIPFHGIAYLDEIELWCVAVDA